VTVGAEAPLLEARHVTKIYGGGLIDRKNVTVALSDFSLSISGDRPSITAVVGESGSGKTTLARSLLGLATPTHGEVRYRGTNLQSLSNKQQRRFLHDVQVIFQDPFEVYNPFYKVDHVLETPIKKFKLAKSKNDARQLIDETLRGVGLRPEETLGRYPHQLSGGQRQRIMVARALLLRPRLIVADEPVSMVDASLRATILDSLRDLNQRFGISLIYITHDLTTAYQISDTIIVLYKGTVAEAGDVEHVVKEPLHPYSQLLVGSIPLPDPNHAWQKEEGGADTDEARNAARVGCTFADRCPYVMPVCGTAMPPLYRTEPRRAASCYRYDQAPTLASEDLQEVLGTVSEPSPASSS
jgi:peptide/nickel transport system ATP-binding protein